MTAWAVFLLGATNMARKRRNTPKGATVIRFLDATGGREIAREVHVEGLTMEAMLERLDAAKRSTFQRELIDEVFLSIRRKAG